MAMFGGMARTFAQPQIDGDLSLQPVRATDTAPATPPLNLKPGFFSSGGAGVNILGAIGDTLATAGGGQATFLPMLAQQHQQQAILARQQQQQAAEFQRQVAYEQWKRTHPEPTAIERNATYLDTQGSGLGHAYLTNYANNGGAQGPASISVNGQQMVRAPGAAGPPQPSGEDVARLRTNPHEAALFEQIYGPGSANRYLSTGGAAPAAGAPFPPMQGRPAR